MDPFRMESLSTPEEEERVGERDARRVDAVHVRAVVVWHVVGVCVGGEAANGSREVDLRYLVRASLLKKERKKTANPREGWENGTPPPHRDFNVVRAGLFFFAFNVRGQAAQEEDTQPREATVYLVWCVSPRVSPPLE